LLVIQLLTWHGTTVDGAARGKPGSLLPDRWRRVLRGGALDGSAGGRLAVHPAADEFGCARPSMGGRIVTQHRYGFWQHVLYRRAAGVRFAPVTGKSMRRRDPHPLGRVTQGQNQLRHAGGVHDVVEDLAAVLTHLRTRVAKPAPGLGRPFRPERDQPLVGADRPVLVAEQPDQVSTRRARLGRVSDSGC
jgi:hypothetical protein